MQCCSETCDTKFCPHCGREMGKNPIHGLMKHIDAHIKTQQTKMDAESALQKIGHAAERQAKWLAQRQQSLAKWISWRESISILIVPDQSVLRETQSQLETATLALFEVQNSISYQEGDIDFVKKLVIDALDALPLPPGYTPLEP